MSSTSPESIASLGIDSSGVTSGVRSTLEALKAAFAGMEAFETGLEKLNRANLEAVSKFESALSDLKERNNAHFTGLVTAQKDAMTKAVENLRKGKFDTLNLVSSETQELQKAYEMRKAMTIKMSDEEVRVWKAHGVKVSGFHAAQLKGMDLLQTVEKAQAAGRLADLETEQKGLLAKLEDYQAKNLEAIRRHKKRYGTEIAATQTELANNSSEIVRVKALVPSSYIGTSVEEKARQANADDRIRHQMQAEQAAAKLRIDQETHVATLSNQLLKTNAAIAVRLETDKQTAIAVLQKSAQANADDRIRHQMQAEQAAAKLRIDQETHVATLSNQLLKVQAAQVATTEEAKRAEWLKSAQMQVRAATNNATDTYQRYAPNAQIAGGIVNKQAVVKEDTSWVGAASYLGGTLNRMPMDTEAISRLNKSHASLLKVREEVTKLKLPTLEAASAMHKFSIDGNDAHSAARGLASGFNLLWLTWGNLVPLFAGAAISNGFMQTAKVGMQVGDTFAIIGALGENSGTQIAGLKDKLLELGSSGPIGPLKLAESMKVLSLAGMKADAILSNMKTVVNFSVVGATDLKTAADTLVSVSIAFGLGYDNFARVSDVIAKAAAESKVSVESFSSAMKTASVIHKQYGATLEDTAVQIAALAQIGIEGTAAGTAVRNMYADLSGRSKEVSKLLKQQGLEFRESTGAFKSVTDIISMMDAKLRGLTGIEQVNLIQKIFGERGAKDFIEMLDLAREKSEKLGISVQDAMKSITANISNSAGYSAINAATLAHTTQKEFETMAAGVQTSLVKAFEKLEPHLVLTFDAMQKLFNSEGFSGSIGVLVSIVGALTEALAANGGTLALLGGGYLGLKTVQMGVAATTSLLTVSTMSQVEVEAASAAATLSAVKSKNLSVSASERKILIQEAELRSTQALLAVEVERAVIQAKSATAAGLLGRAISSLNTAVVAATVAYVAYEMAMSLWNNTAEKSAKLTAEKVVESLKTQADHIAAVNKLLREGIGLQEAEARIKGSKDAKESGSNYDQARKASNDAYDKLRKEEDRQKNTPAPVGSSKGRADSIRSLTADYNAAAAVRDAALKLHSTTVKETQRNIDEQAERNRLLAPKSTHLAGLGVMGDSTAAARAARLSAQSAKLERQTASTQIAELSENLAKTITMEKSASDTELAILEGKHRNKLISEGEYQAKLNALLTDLDNKTTASREETLKAQAQLYITEYASIASQIAKSSDPIAVNKLENELASLSKTWSGLANKFAADEFVEASKKQVKLANAISDSEGEIKKLSDSVDKFLTKDSIGIEKGAESLGDAFSKYGKVSAEAAATETARFKEELTLLALEAQKTAESLAFLWNTDATAMQNALSRMEAIDALIEKVKSKQGPAVSEAVKNAVNKAKAADFSKFSAALADAIIKGEGLAGLRNVIANELIREPFELFIKATVQSVTGMASDALGLTSGAASNTNALAGLAHLSKLASAFNGAGLAGLANSSVGATLGLSETVTTEAGVTHGLTQAGSAFAGLPIGGILTAYSVGGVNGFAAGVATTAIAGAIGTLGTATTALAGATTALAAIGPYGWAALGVAALLGMGGGDVATRGLGRAGATYSSKGAITSSFADNSYGASDTEVAAMVKVNSALAADFFSKANALGITAAANLAFEAGANTGKDSANPNIVYGSTSGTLGYSSGEVAVSDKEAVALAANRAVLVALQGSELPKYLQGAFDGITASSLSQSEIDAWYTGAQAIKDFHDSLASAPWDNLKDMSYAAIQTMSAYSGGVQALGTKLSSFYTQFYTEETKTARLTESTSKAFTALGASMPAEGLRDWYRGLVESKLALDQTVPANAIATAGALALSEAVNTLAPAFDNISRTSQQVQDSIKAMTAETKTLDVAMLRASGDTAGADKLQRQLDITSNKYTKAEIALYDYNTQLSKNIETTKLNADWTNQLSIAMGTATQRSVELKSVTDQSVRDLMVQTWAYGDLQTATEDLTAAQNTAISSQKSYQDALASSGSSVAAFIKSLQPASKVNLGRLSATYYTDLTLAKAGSASASSRVAESGKAYLDATLARAQTSTEARIATQKMITELKSLPAVKAFEESLLEKVDAITGAVKDLNGKLVADLTVTARSAIVKLIQFVADTDNLPADLKDLALGSVTGTFKKTVDFLVGLSISDTDKAIALATANSALATFEKIVKFTALGSLSESDKAIVMAGATSYDAELSKTVRFTYANPLDESTKTLLLASQSSIEAIYKDVSLALTSGGTTAQFYAAVSAALAVETKMIRLAAQNFGEADVKVIAEAQAALTRTVGLAVSRDNDATALQIVQAQSDTINRIITASGGELTPDQKKLIDGVIAYNKKVTIETVIDQTSLDAAKRLLVDTINNIPMGNGTLGSATGGSAGTNAVNNNPTQVGDLAQAIQNTTLTEAEKLSLRALATKTATDMVAESINSIPLGASTVGALSGGAAGVTAASSANNAASVQGISDTLYAKLLTGATIDKAKASVSDSVSAVKSQAIKDYASGATKSAALQWWEQEGRGGVAGLDAALDKYYVDLETLHLSKPEALKKIYADVQAVGVSMADLERAWTQFAPGDLQAAFATVGIPRFAKGTNYLPSDMLAQVHKGERIIPAADNRELMQRLQSHKGEEITPRAYVDTQRAEREETNALLREILMKYQATQEELAGLRAEARAIASYTNKTAKLIDRAMPTGNAIAIVGSVDARVVV